MISMVSGTVQDLKLGKMTKDHRLPYGFVLEDRNDDPKKVTTTDCFQALAEGKYLNQLLAFQQALKDNQHLRVKVITNDRIKPTEDLLKCDVGEQLMQLSHGAITVLDDALGVVFYLGTDTEGICPDAKQTLV